MAVNLYCLFFLLLMNLTHKYAFYLQIPVHVYYEALCPDSQAFITEQLYPTVSGPLGKFVELKLVPYGKSNVSVLKTIGFLQFEHLLALVNRVVFALLLQYNTSNDTTFNFL